jgi:anti-sigma-K factor RskA
MSERHDDRQKLASSVLLGYATTEEVERFEQLSATDVSFRALVSEIEQFLAPLNELSPEAEPPEGLLEDLMRAIDDDQAGTTVARASAPARKTDTASRPAPERPWQLATAAAAAIAVVALGLHLVPDTSNGSGASEEEQSASVREELLTLMTAGEETPTVVVLLYDRQSDRITGRLANAQLPDNGVWQLWLLRDGIDAPQSLGVLSELSEDGAINLSIATELEAGSDTLAISVEPVGGSPEAGPTGPIVFTGAVDPI